jgi:hypothetical protein
MFTTMKQAAVNANLSNLTVTTYGFSLLGLVVVHEQAVIDKMIEKGYPLHTAFGKKFFFCLLERCY